MSIEDHLAFWQPKIGFKGKNGFFSEPFGILRVKPLLLQGNVRLMPCGGAKCHVTWRMQTNSRLL